MRVLGCFEPPQPFGNVAYLSLYGFELKPRAQQVLLHLSHLSPSTQCLHESDNRHDDDARANT
jgi:hypothetical protein